MITLTKIGEKHSISLDKNSDDIITVKAEWIDNNDGDSGNDDLDLRAGLLLPNGEMKMIHCRDSGKINEKPYIEHMGDVTSASKNNPGQEIMKVNAKISEFYKGPIAIVFSVYSAISNGAVSVASLKPKMKIEYKDQVIECAYDFSSKNEAPKGFFKKLFGSISSDKYIYTYVIGTVKIIGNEVEISPSGQTSKPHSEATPKLKWINGNDLELTIDGEHLFKD